MVGTIDTQGRLLVNAWPGNTPIFFNPDDNKQYVWLPTTVGGIVTGYWLEMPTMAGCGYRAFNESDGLYYCWTVTLSGGIPVGDWVVSP